MIEHLVFVSWCHIGVIYLAIIDDRQYDSKLLAGVLRYYQLLATCLLNLRNFLCENNYFKSRNFIKYGSTWLISSRYVVSGL